jgi:hypothetical protein
MVDYCEKGKKTVMTLAQVVILTKRRILVLVLILVVLPLAVAVVLQTMAALVP